MFLLRAVRAGVLVALVASPAVAQRNADLVSREVRPKRPVLKIPVEERTGRLVVKFNDSLKARAVGEGQVISLTNADPMDSIQEIAEHFQATFTRAFPVHDDVKLAGLQARAATISGKAQPDLAGIMYVDVAAFQVDQLADVLNALDIVEWVEIEPRKRPIEPIGGAGPGGACCLVGGGCADVADVAECNTLGGVYQEDGTSCADANIDCQGTGACCTIDDACIDDSWSAICENNGGDFIGVGEVCEDDTCDLGDCGDAGTGDCYDLLGNGSPFCDDEACCELVCDNDIFCCDVDNPFATWDTLCAAQALLFCGAGDPCASPANGGCFEPHPQGGCNNSDCCNTVCSTDPTCCFNDNLNGWDEVCVMLAQELCIDPANPQGATPDFRESQGYLTAPAYDPIPLDLAPFLPVVGGIPFIGYDGSGWNLGDPQNPAGDDDDPYPGLIGLAQELLEVYGVDATGLGNLTTGRTTKIAVIEWAYYPDHEELQHVTLEPGQTLILIPEITSPNHGTATLSIATARDESLNGGPQRGIAGVSPESSAYFFPLTSIEEGPRESAAWVNALLTLGQGDVISTSYGPGPPIGNLNNSLFSWTLIRIASDLGITTTIAAGNDCFNVSGAPDLGDSGGIVVGACSPGLPFYRLVFSNYGVAPDNARSNIVHLKAWGEMVAAAGYASLYDGADLGNGLRRTYTATFNGTSAASPQIAGLVANLQGLAKQFYGIPLMPEQIRGILGAPGVPPPLPAPRLFGGHDGPFCTLDVNPEIGPFMIGPYPDVAGNFGSAGSVMLNQSSVGFDDSPLVDSIEILRGTKVFGNVFSIKGSDNNRLKIKSEYTEPTDNQHLGITYLGYGHMTDVKVVAHADIPVVGTVAVIVEGHSSDGLAIAGGGLVGNALLFVELFDWANNRWQVQAIDNLLITDPVLIPLYPVVNAWRFVNDDDRIETRVWTLTLGGLFGGGFGGAPDGTYLISYDWIDIRVGVDGDIFLPP